MRSSDKKEKKRPRFVPERANSAHILLLVIVGAYLIYSGYKMYENTSTGASTMSMGQTLILAAVMCIAALFVFAYAAYVGYWMYKKSNEPDPDPEENVEESSDDGVE
ncbi:MAG: hypothetical protein LUI02_01945 [Clostridiales bacterium]|nr:hypothetical protein [Clostridiales bacterium]